MFPAYDRDSPSCHTAPPDEENDFSGRFGSFASNSKKNHRNKEQRRHGHQEIKRKEKLEREKERERERMLSQHSIKMVSIDSDDESDIEVPIDTVSVISVRQKKKSKHSSKKRKRDKRQRRHTSSSSQSSTDSSKNSVSSSSSGNKYNARPSVPQILCANHKWSFMKEFNQSNASSFMVMDLKGDRSNVHYESLYKGDVAQYDFLLKKVLGGDETLQRFRFGILEKKDDFQRYFSDKVSKAWKEEPERLWRRKELKPFTDYIELSRFALSEDDLKDEDGNLSLEKCKAVQGGRSLVEATPEVRSRKYNAELGKDRHNIDLWLKFLAVQDEVFLAQNNLEVKKTRNERLTNRDLLQRKMSILDKAISYNFNCVKLKLERLKIGMHLWEEDVFIREIRDVEFKHVNDPEMWQGVLDLLESDTRRFNLTNQCMKMKICLEKLDEIRSGKLLSHKALPNTEQFMASVILRKIRLLLKCGHTEKAIGTAQAICEFNLCVPESFKSANLDDRRKLFEAFWDSGVARIGDEGAEGWAKSMERIKEGAVQTDRSLCLEEQLEYEKKEAELCNRVGSNGLKLPCRRVWIEIERLRTQYQWRPIRDLGATFDDRERVVTFQDIEDVLFVLNPSAAFDLFCNIVEEFGAVIYGRDSALPMNIMHEFAIFPDLSIRLRNFEKSLSRFFELASNYIQEERDLLLSSQLLTYLNLLKMDGDLSEKIRLKKFRDEAKKICNRNNNVHNTSLMATFAEKMCELGENDAAKICANKFLVVNMWCEVDMVRAISLLRMAIVCISATDDETEKRRLIAGFICEGRPVADVRTDAEKIEKQVNIRLHNLLTTNCVTETWEGSTVDLAASLFLLFAYYYADNSKRLYNLKKCYTTLSGFMKNNSQRRFTKSMMNFQKKYVELLRMHLTNNPCEPQRLLAEASIMAHQKFPTEVSFLKIYIDSCAVGTRVIHLRRFLENDVKDWHANYCLAFGSVYLELFRHRMLLETSDFQSPELHRLRAVVKKSSERICHRDDIFWRLLLLIENERKDTLRAREVFYLAYAECPWSKSLIMDYKNVGAGEHEKLLDALVEKKLRLRCEHEEVVILLDMKNN